MEKRAYRRVQIHLDAEIMSCGKVHKGLIRDVSVEGLGSVLTTRIDVTEKFSPEQIIWIAFQLPTGKHLSFKCEIRWLFWEDPKHKVLTLGVRIINPPAEYIQYIHDDVLA